MKKILLRLIPFLIAPIFGVSYAKVTDSIEFGNLLLLEGREHYYRSPPVVLSFQDAPLEDVIHVLAQACGLNFQLDSLQLPKISTYSKMNPFKTLELMVERNGLSMVEKDNFWFISQAKDTQLFEKTYTLENIHLSAMSHSLSKKQESAHTHDYGSAVSSLVSAIGEPRERTANKLPVVEQIEKILQMNSKEDLESFVSYDPDSNHLFVIADKKRQNWVQNYLETIDHNIPNIEMKIMFISSSESPEKQLGVDWSGTLADGYTLGVSGLNDSGHPTKIDWGSLSNLKMPTTAILHTDALVLKLRGFERESKNQTKRYPLLTGYSNREVIIRFTKNEPIVATTSDTQVQTSASNIGAGTTSTVEVKQEEVGTIVRLLPRVIQGGRLSMDIDIGVSNILGFKSLKGNEYPIISQTRYQGQTTVESGYTIVVGGLEEIISHNTAHHIPFLENLPVFGWLFKDVVRSDNKQKLSMYISVRLLNSRGEVTSPPTPVETPSPGIQTSIDRLNHAVKAMESDFLG